MPAHRGPGVRCHPRGVSFARRDKIAHTALLSATLTPSINTTPGSSVTASTADAVAFTSATFPRPGLRYLTSKAVVRAVPERSKTAAPRRQAQYREALRYR